MSKQIIGLGLVFLLLILSLYFFLESNTLKNENTKLAKNINELNNSLTQTNKTLAQTNNSLNQKTHQLEETTNELFMVNTKLNTTKNQLKEKDALLRNLTSNLLELEERYQNLNKTVGDLKNELSSLEDGVHDYVSWFKNNSNFSSDLLNNEDVFSFVREIKKKCVDAGVLNLACLPFVMEKKLDFRYIDEDEDKLYTLEEIIHNNGGDCEDFSIFTMASLNYLKNDLTTKDIELDSWVTKIGSKFTIYQTDTNYWYLNDAEGHYLGDLKNLNPSVFCYIIQCTTDSCEGHCVVGVSETELNTISDLEDLTEANLFEPQSGKYLGKIGSSYILCNSAIENCDKEKNHVFVIIGHDDLYVFREGNWTSYKYYLGVIDKLKKEI